MQRLWLAITPLLFLILWSAGYVVAKVALVDAAPMALLALRFAAVIAIMAVLFAVLRPPLPKSLSGYLHLGFVGFLMQTVYFGMAYFSFVNGVAAGTAALIFSLQPVLVALLAPRWTGEVVDWVQWLGLAIAMVGTLTVIIARLEIGPPPLAGFGFAAFSVGIAAVTGPARYNRAKQEAYECGIEPSPQALEGGRFPVKYFLTAMLFIVFDIEIVFLYPWAVTFDQLGLFGLVEMAIFIGTVFIAYAYVWRRGGLEWD